MTTGNGMCPVCKVVPRETGGGYCTGCTNKLQNQYYHRRKASYTLGTWVRPSAGKRKPPTDWRAVLAASESK